MQSISRDTGCGGSGEEIRRAFRVFGFVVVRGALQADEVAAVREALDRAFESAQLRDLPVMCTSESLQCELVWSCLFRPRVVGWLRAALGPELYYQNDLHVQRNSYGQAGLQRHHGWHMDAGSETHNGYLRAPDYRFAKCGIFLQDFDNGWGGGIRVKPKSHRKLFEPNPIKRGLFVLRRAADRAAIRLGVDLDTLEVSTRAGDLCFFDSRLLHSSVLPEAPNITAIGYDRRKDVSSFWAAIPREHTKYVIYWDACNRAMVEDFLRNSMRRSEAEVADMHEQPCHTAAFTRYLSVRYPDDYPVDFVSAAVSRDVGIASLDVEGASFYKRKLRSMRLLHP